MCDTKGWCEKMHKAMLMKGVTQPGYHRVLQLVNNKTNVMVEPFCLVRTRRCQGEPLCVVRYLQPLRR